MEEDKNKKNTNDLDDLDLGGANQEESADRTASSDSVFEDDNDKVSGSIGSEKENDNNDDMAEDDERMGDIEESLKSELDFDDLSEGDDYEAEEKKEMETIALPKSKVMLIKKLLKNIKESSDQIMNLLSGVAIDEDEVRIGISQISEPEIASAREIIGGDKVIEGVFDGEKMIGPDGKQYVVPANYASKSKLIEGDMLKLTITANGTFLYKQIGPIERIRVVGVLNKDDEGNYFVTDDRRRWKVLTASVTYFRGEAGDETVILVPKVGESKWAAVENIVKS